MNKLKMSSMDIVSKNVEKIEKLFPNCISEGKIDFDMLKQELSNDIIYDGKEKYQLSWVGKKEALVNANTPCNKTLRPVKEKSVDFDNTKNIYIEGDNLEVLKILQESYLNKIKCIYIDPPYNTGNDFVYNDKFVNESELKESGQIDEYNNRLISNQESNGKYHSDWLSMMYPRLKLARNLLRDDGAIFISIDDNEIANLKEICDEIFGEKNFVEIFSWAKTETPANLAKMTKKSIEYILCYKKSDKIGIFRGLKKISKSSNGLMNQTNTEKILSFPAFIVDTSIKDGIISKGIYGTENYKIELIENTEVKDGYFIKPIILKGKFKWGQEKLDYEIKNGTKISIRTIALSPSYEKTEYAREAPWNIINSKFNVGTNENASVELKNIMGEKIFDFPKPVSLLKYIFNFLINDDDIIMDFFSGSATSAQAVLEINKENQCNNRYILIQLPEKMNDKYHTICDFAEERIKRIDIEKRGFRVYKTDLSNMKDVYYAPTDLQQSQLNMFESNIKEDRTAEDLLTQVILDLGLTLDLSIEEKKILNNNVYFVENNSLVACFDDTIDINIVDEICKCNPLKIVFKESSFKTDSDKINVFERIKKISQETEVNVI